MIDYIKAYCDSKQISNSPRTVRNYRFALRLFEHYVSKPLENVTRADLERYFTWNLMEKEKPIARSTAATYQNQLRAFYIWMEEREYITKSPMKGIAKIKYPDSMPIYLEVSEIKEMIRVAEIENPRDAMLIRFMYATGVRVSELVGVCKQDINWTESTARVMGKGSKERDVPIPEVFRGTLEEYCRGFKFDQRLFEYSTATVERDIHIIAAQAGIKKHVTPHKLRHSFATHMLAGGVNIVVIQQFLGHSSLNTTQKYAHVSKKDKIDAYNKGHPMSLIDI